LINLINPIWYQNIEFAKFYFKKLVLNAYELDSQIDIREHKYANKELDFSLDNQSLDSKIDLSINLIKQISFYIKPYIGSFERKRTNFKEANYKFYDEREWRYKPKIPAGRSFLTKNEFFNEKMLNYHNALQDTLKFNLSDIDMIFVKNNRNIKQKIWKNIRYFSSNLVNKCCLFKQCGRST